MPKAVQKRDKLNGKEEMFCVYYTNIGDKTFSNGTKSYLKAYPEVTSENTAAVLAHRLLRKAKIQHRIVSLHEQNLTRNGVTECSVLANIQHDRLKAREAGQFAAAAQLTKMEGEYLSMFKQKIDYSSTLEETRKQRLLLMKTPEFDMLQTMIAKRISEISRGGDVLEGELVASGTQDMVCEEPISEDNSPDISNPLPDKEL
jgi:hypothetical protein